MLEIEVELPQGTKTIEWNKAHPTFQELKQRLRQCGIGLCGDVCVEVERGGGFLIPDNNGLLDGPKIRARASQIVCTTTTKIMPNQPPRKDCSTGTEKVSRAYHNRYEELFVEGVIPFVGRVFVLSKKHKNINLEDCTGTVALVGPKGESIGAFHSVRKAWKHPRHYDVYIQYMNHNKYPCFPAKVVVYDDQFDIFIASPLPPFQLHFPKFLQPASGIAMGDTVHCIGFPKLMVAQMREHTKSNITAAPKDKEFPAVFTGNVCFSGWKQVLADYRSLPNNSGAVVVDDCGHLKGIHVSSLNASKYVPEHTEFQDDKAMADPTKTFFDQVNRSLPQLLSRVQQSTEAAIFIPVNILMKTLVPAIHQTTSPILYKSTPTVLTATHPE
ncbi:uncharacterized protein [Physcomitrium patens]|uniref:Uncharacterized protein n=1 Tax=Physcomitrium patens TaxID=3218 RepID=A0A2K1ICT1_PHYPA|nr:uncharacterized protein LOC112277910 [Physcomitrium patens]PNR27077.1 hypothetical protein PHYPA_030558 [Physcomitrium patens]|eukprot:XP_024366523.1 uncharacterized protein LOC112277910 [Physcomitrella patens]